MSRPRVLFFVACPATFAEIIPFLNASGFKVETQPLRQSADSLRLGVSPDVVIVEHSGDSGYNALSRALEFKRSNPALPVVIATTSGSEEVAIDTLRAGLQDYIKLPCPQPSFLAQIQRLLPLAPGPVERSSSEFPRKNSTQMLAVSDSMTEIRKYLQKAANSNCTVLITGETGTGKELVAEFIHEHSPRRGNPFVCVNCAAIPETLLESELFGHNRGAFTGAQELTEGLLYAADGGTVFLDEIGDLSPVAQAKILRVLETKQFCRVGGTKQMRLDLRFVAATNQDLYSMTAQKTFREDLLFRLDVAHVHLPPLRERKEDIPLLVQEFMQRFSQEGSAQIPKFTDEFLGGLLKYNWPGNVRELKNVIERLFLLELSTFVGVEHLPSHVRQFLATSSGFSKGERELLISTLFSTKWNKTKAAEMLNWSRMTLYRKIAKYHIPENPSPEKV